MTSEDRGAMILTHGRAENVRTVKTLREGGYTGRILLVVDDLDPEQDLYETVWADEPGVDVVVFDKTRAAERVDLCDNLPELGTVTIARNEAWRIAEARGWTHFCILEDDYTWMGRRVLYRTKGVDAVSLGSVKGSLDSVFDAMWSYLDGTPFSCVCGAQGGDFIGGAETYEAFTKERLRKAMNWFFCRTDRPIEWTGRMNDDLNGSILGQIQRPMLTVRNVILIQVRTQEQEGGLSSMYLEYGTYTKSMYSVIQFPSCVSIGAMGEAEKRIHHVVKWRYAVPRILSERYRKARA